MSWEARDAADEISIEYGLKPVDRLILDRLADRAGKLGEAIFPSVATLKHLTGASESTIQRAIRHFLKIGILEYGDAAMVAHIPADKRPRVYNMVLNAARRAKLMLRKVGRMPWQKKKPVDKSPAKPERGVTVTPKTPPTGCQGDRQTFNHLKINQEQPPADAVPASLEVADYQLVLEMRQASRDRLAKRGIHITEPLPPVPAPELVPV